MRTAGSYGQEAMPSAAEDRLADQNYGSTVAEYKSEAKRVTAQTGLRQVHMDR